jgi:dTDP-4-dehydrorhamnose reductase
MTSILLVGAAGQLGRAIQDYAQAHDLRIIACTRQELDATQPESIKKTFELHRPQFLINAAAYTAVDLAETEREAALLNNAYAAENLAKACKDFNCIMIHVSTDYVFDGQLDRPYQESDRTQPLGVYGQTKLLGEQLVQQAWQKHIILRVSWVFGEHGKNFVKTMLRLASNQETLKIVNDQKGCPTNALHIAAVIFKLINQLKNQQQNFGIYHYCDLPMVSWYEFANAIIAEAKKLSHVKVKEILPITTAEFPTPAKRPQNSELDCHKIEQAFHIKRFDWRADLPILMRNILAQSK